MKAQVGDRLVQESFEARRSGVVIEVRGPDGSPPYLVRWPDDHRTLVFPGPGARIVPVDQGESATPSGRVRD